MPRPTAPMIQAEYHNYEHSQFNDYYGGYEPRANGNGTVQRQETVPMRIELVDKDVEKCHSTKSSAMCINIMLLISSLTILILLAITYYLDRVPGIRNDSVFYVAAFEAATIFTCLLMCYGLSANQPFFCIGFVCLRTMEAFFWACGVAAMVWAVIEGKRADPYIYIEKLVVQVHREYYPDDNINLVDLSLQLCIGLMLVCMFGLALSIYACRVSWRVTLAVTDEWKKSNTRKAKEPNRIMVASDEMYCNY